MNKILNIMGQKVSQFLPKTGHHLIPSQRLSQLSILIGILIPSFLYFFSFSIVSFFILSFLSSFFPSFIFFPLLSLLLSLSFLPFFLLPSFFLFYSSFTFLLISLYFFPLFSFSCGHIFESCPWPTSREQNRMAKMLGFTTVYMMTFR